MFMPQRCMPGVLQMSRSLRRMQLLLLMMMVMIAQNYRTSVLQDAISRPCGR